MIQLQYLLLLRYNINGEPLKQARQELANRQIMTESSSVG
jgi:hypothetical protein